MIGIGSCGDKMYLKTYRWSSDETENTPKPQLRKGSPNVFDQSADSSPDSPETYEHATRSELIVHSPEPPRISPPEPSAEESVIKLADPETAQEQTTQSFVENLEASRAQPVTMAKSLQAVLSKYEGFMAKRSRSNTEMTSSEQLQGPCRIGAHTDDAMPMPSPSRPEETSSQTSTTRPPRVKTEGCRQRHKKVSPHTNKNSRYRVHKKCAPVKKSQGYEFLSLAAVQETADGTLEYEVVWAPSFVPIEYLQGQQAFAEAQDLVLKAFGHHAWEEEMEKF